MAQPIRWDNIASRGNADAMSGVNSAANIFRSAFSDLQGTLKEREAIDAANWQNTKANNTSAYLDRVAQFRDADALKAGQGELDALRSQFGFQIDANAARGAVDQRLNTLMDQRTKQVGYDRLLRDERTAPLLDTMKKAALEGKKDVFNQAMTAYTAAGGTDGAGALRYMLDRDRQVVEQGQGDKLFQDKLDTGEAQRQHMRNQDANANARLALEGRSLDMQQQRLDAETETRLSAQLNDAIETMGKSSNLSIGSVEGQAKIADYIGKIKDPDIADNARYAAAEMAKQNPRMSLAGVLAGIGSIGKRDWFINGDMLYSNENNVDDAVARGMAFDKSPEAIDYLRRQEIQKLAAQDRYEKVNARLEQLRRKKETVANPFEEKKK